MASQQGQNLSHKAGEMVGQAQMKKDEFMSQASETMQSSENSSYASQATNFLQQTGEQVKSMAQGAAEAVKNTLGMNPADDNTSTTNRPSNPSTRI